MTQEASREADLPAQQARAQASPRLPCADGDRWRSQGPGPAPRQGPRDIVGLTDPAGPGPHAGPASPLPVQLVKLRNRAEFLWVRKGPRVGRTLVVIEARRRDANGPAAVGFTATKKIGGAVVRNRAKRRLREAARELLPAVGLAGVAYVLIARDGTASAPWAALLDDVRTALIRLAAQVDGRDPRRSGGSTTMGTASTPPPSEVSAPNAARANSRPEDDEA